MNSQPTAVRACGRAPQARGSLGRVPRLCLRWQATLRSLWLSSSRGLTALCNACAPCCLWAADAAALEVLVADRIVAAANNKVVSLFHCVAVAVAAGATHAGHRTSSVRMGLHWQEGELEKAGMHALVCTLRMLPPPPA